MKQLRDKGVNLATVAFGTKTWPLKLLYCAVARRNSFYRVHTMNLWILMILFLLGLMPQASIYDHNHSRYFQKFSIRWRLLRMLLRHAREVVVVHEHLVPFHDGLGPKIRVESPFIPPDTNEEHSIVATYPDWVMPFVGWNEGYVILNSASRFDESDLYGFLASVKLVHRLNERGIRARLLFAFVSFEQRLVPDDMRNLISNLQGRGLLRILSGNFEIWPLFKRVDVFLRTTATDGESVSILEALHFSCPTVASNVVPRPYGVSTYQFGEMRGLVDVVTKVLLKEQS